VYFTVYSSTFTDMQRNSILVWCFVYFVASLAGLALPFRRRDLFDASPKVINRTWLGLPAIAVLAAVSSVIQLALLVIAATNKGLSGGYDSSSITMLAILAFSGTIVYVISRTYVKRVQRIDIDLAMRELPPE
jgi:hypothetical protein